MPIRNGRAVKARVVGVGDPVVDGLSRPGVTPAGRTLGTGARQAAPGSTVATILALDVLVRTATTALSAERVVTDTTTLTWDWATAGQAKANVQGAPWAGVTGRPTTLSGYGITDAVPSSRIIATTAPLTGGGNLSADRTLAISAASGSAAGSMSAADFTKLANLASDSFTGTASTTDATVTTCGSYTVPTGKTSVITATVSGHKDDHTQGLGYVLVGAFRNNAGTVTQIGVTTVVVPVKDDILWGATFDVSGTSVRVRVNAVAATNVAWTTTAVVTNA